MPTGTGVDAQFMFKNESVVGTPVTVDHSVEFVSESLNNNPGWIEPAGLGLGAGNPQRGARVVQAHADANGPVIFEVANRTFGLLWKQALGSAVTTPTNITGTAYKQVHQLGSQNGMSLTAQTGTPEPSTDTVIPFTYNGVKVKSWTFEVSDSEMAKLTLDLDGWSEVLTTALATSTPVAGAYPFNFSQISAFKIGGTASTTTGVVSIATGSAISAIIKKFSIKCDWSLATDRWGLSLANKGEQLPATPVITGSLDAEFKKTEWYDIYKAKTPRPMQLTFTGAQIAATGQFDTLDFVIPQTLIKTDKTDTTGPGIVRSSVEFGVYWDEVNNGLQVTLISADSAL